MLLDVAITAAQPMNGNNTANGMRGGAGMLLVCRSPVPLRILFVVGRPFSTRMEPHETLTVLKPYLARHFAVMEEEQLLQWRNQDLDWNRTVAESNMRRGEDGVVTVNLTSINKRNLYLLVKTPSGKGIVIGFPHTAQVVHVKQHICDRQDADLEGESPNLIRLMCNYNELADEATLGFYRLQTGQTLLVSLKPRPSRLKGIRNAAGNSSNLNASNAQQRVSLRVEDPHGVDNVVQLDVGESLSALRGVLSDEDRNRCDLFVNGERILDEDQTLETLGVARTSTSQFMFKRGMAPLSPNRRGRSH